MSSLQQVGIVAIFDTRNFDSGVSRYKSGLKSATSATQNFNTQINNINMSQFNTSVTNTGSSLGSLGSIAGGAALAGVAALTAGVMALGAALVDSVGVAMEFEQGMANLAAVSGKSIAEVDELRDLALDLSVNPELTVTATEAAGALEMLAKNGVSAEDILAGVGEATIALSNATGSDFSKSADIATDAMNLFGIEASEFTRVADAMTAVVTNSKFDMNDMALAMAQGAPTASAMGISLEQFNAIMATTASGFASGTGAGTAFKVAMGRLQAPTTATSAAMQKLGIDLYDTNGKAKDITEIWEQLQGIQGKVVQSTTEIGGRTQEQNDALADYEKQLIDLNKEIYDWENNLSSAAVASTAAARAQKENQMQIEKANLEGQIAQLQALQGEFITTERVLTDAEIDEALIDIFGQRGKNWALAAMKVTTAELEEMTAKMEVEGQAAQAAATRTQTFDGALKRMWSSIELVQIQIGDMFLPALTALLDKGITPLIKAMPTLAGIAGAAFSRLVAMFGGFLPTIDLGFIDRLQEAFNAFDISGFGGLFQNLGFGLEGVKFGNMLEMAIAEGDYNKVVDLLGGKLGEVFTIAFESIQKLNVGYLAGIIPGLLGDLFGVDMTVGDAFDSITEILGSAFEEFQKLNAGFLLGGLGGLIGELMGLETTVGDVFGKTSEGINAFMSEGFEGKGAQISFLDSLGFSPEQIESVITSVDTLKRSIDAIFTGGPQGANMMEELFGDLGFEGGDMLNIMEVVDALFAGDFSTAANSLSVQLEMAFNQAIADAMRAMESNAIDFMTMLGLSEESQAAIFSAVDSVFATIMSIPEAISEFSEGGFQGLAEYFGLPNFIPMLEELGGIMSDFFEPTIINLKDGFIEFLAAFEPIIPKVGEFFAAIEDAMPTIMAFVGGGLLAAIGAIKLLGEVVAWALPIVGEIISSSFQVALNYATSLMEGITAVGEIFTAFMEGDMEGIKDGFISLGAAIVSGFLAPFETEMAQKFFNYMTGVVQSGLDAGYELLEPYLAVGIEFVTQMADGAISRINYAVEKITEVMTAMYDKAMQMAADFADVGFEAMTYIADSIWENIGLVQGALGDVIGQAVQAVLDSIGLPSNPFSSQSTRTRSAGRESSQSLFDSLQRSAMPSMSPAFGARNITNNYYLNVNNSLPGDTIRSDFELMKALA